VAGVLSISQDSGDKMSPDICMCTGVSCPMAVECYRHLATEDRYQSYFSQPPVVKDEENKLATCEYFWPVEGRKKCKHDSK